MIPVTYQILTNLNCNLDCHYCYERKNPRRNTPEDIELFLEKVFHRDKDKDAEVHVEIIGGESLMYPALVDCAYSKARELAQEYGKTLRMSISTNGTLLGKPEVREVLLKHRQFLNIGISIDGPKDVHDANRIYVNGGGSYDEVVANLPWLFKHFCQPKLGVKATFTNETMERYAECVKHLFGLGFNEVAANLVYEEYADDSVILPQLMEVADFLVDHPHLNLLQLPRNAPIPTTIDPDNDRNYCGSCQFMECLGFDRKVYGCNRFCTMGERGVPVGILTDEEIVPINQTFKQEVINQWQEYPQECVECNLKATCASCAAAPYEEGDVRAYLAQKRMCGWTHAVVLARHYLTMKSKGGLIARSDCDAGKHPD